VQHDDLLLAQLRRQDDAIDTTLLATDQQRSVLQTLEASQQRQPIAYSPYGHRPAESRLTSLLGFNGERRDPVTGHYLLGNGYRAFNPVLMRFNSPDSLSPFEQGGLNSYAYCAGDPINRHDPTGHFALIFNNALTLMYTFLKRTGELARQTTKITPDFRVNSGTHISTVKKVQLNKFLISKDPNRIPLPMENASETRLAKRVNVAGQGVVGKKTMPDATLQGLSYSAIEGSDLKRIYIIFGLRTIDDSVNADNLLNEIARTRRRHLYDAQQRTKKLKELKTSAMNGEIRGVHPDSPYLRDYDPAR
jgi:RHS repeat-associated protein